MSVVVGWSRKSSNPRGLHLHLLEILSVNEGEGRQLIVGWHRFTRRELETLREKRIRVRLRALGIISFADDVSPRLFNEVFTDVRVHGLLRHRPEPITASS